MRAIQISEFGGPEVLRLVDLPTPTPKRSQLLVEVSRAGVNYADTHQAENSYLAPAELPLVPGVEVVGITADGDRVVCLLGSGGYAEQAVANAPLAFAVPDGIDDGTALALILQGTTAWHILRTCAHMAPGESVVVQAAAGGVGTLAVQLAKAWGAGRVIASASSEEKRRLALDLGADVAVDSRADDMKGTLEEANDGRKVDVVLEMAGGSVFDASLSALAPFGRIVTYGMASGTAPEPVHAGALMQRSRAVIGFWLMHCIGRPGMLDEPLAELFAMAGAGRLRAIAGATYPLSEAAQAHRDLRDRTTVGKLLLDPTR